ncbi:MAG: PilZ domain-containing protein [Candidatus Eremiobacteraeota bacterium]|nr:PilZ domain-containing protein [Candidatus Eremiobacteraeota bacterium]
MILIFGFLKNLFSKKNREEETGHPRIKPIDIFEEEIVQVRKDEDVPKLWKGRVLSVTGETFSVDIPELMGEFPFPFREGQDIMVSLKRDKRLAKFQSKLIKIAWKRKPPIIILNFPEYVEWKDATERKHVRIETDLPAKVRIDREGESWHMMRIRDFSLKGLSFLSNESFDKDAGIKVKLMSMEFKLELPGRVTRVLKLEERTSEGKPNFDIGMRFEGLDEMGKKTIANFAWKLQRRGK